MLKELAIGQIREIGKRFRTTVSVFEEQDAGFKPKEEMFGVAYVIAHAGESITWLIEGAFRPEGFNLDFEGHHKRVAEKKTIADAVEHFEDCLAAAIVMLEGRSDDDLRASMPEGPVMGGLPRLAIIEAVSDHTASHRGTLGVYARLLGKKPPMPYE